MAKLFARISSDSGAEVHKIANRQLCADLFYGSREQSVRALTVCETVEPDAKEEKVVAMIEFISPQGKTIYFHREEYPMPKKVVLVEAVAV